MRKSARCNIRHSYILLLLLALLACNNPSWAGVAAYQLDGGTTLPAPVSYWLSADATSVTIDVIDAITSAVIFTFPTITGANATRGFHSNVVTWNGEANVGGAAPPGNYKLRATVRSDMSGTDLKPLWESCSPDGVDSKGWVVYGIGMNRNPNSPFYGRIYVGNRDGDTFVISAGPTCRLEATNHLDGRIFATPAAVGDALYLRTDEALYRIAN